MNEPSRSSEPTLRILLVDDDAVDRVAMRRFLAASDLRAEVDELDRAAGVLERVAARSYDCLVIDHQLPDEDGLALVRRLRASNVTLPILAVTGHEEEVGAQLVAAGASDYLPKADLSPARLARRIRYAMRVGRAEERLRQLLGDLAAERQLLEAVIRQLPAAAVIADAGSRRILLANQQLRDLLGRPVAREAPVEALGDVAAFGAEGQPLTCARWPLARALDTGETVLNEELEIRRDDGRRVVVRASAQPVHAHPGETRASAAVMTLDDITAERHAQAELERAARAREDILAIVSHDLRNPLNAVNVAVDELAEPSLDADTRGRYVAAIKRAVARADRLIRDLLDASRIEAGRLQIDPRPLPARALLEQTAREHELIARDARVRLDVSVVGEPRLYGDRDRLLQALGNLVANAVRYAKIGGVVELAAAAEDSRVRLSVGDRGPGIPPDALPHIFDRYWQAGKQRRAGAGLGLAITRGIAEAHGGGITVENREGGGARFCLSVPACP